MKTIGIVSDIHRVLCDEAQQALNGCDLILCAGDCETPQALIELECIAPTIAVLGNCDPYHIAPGIKLVETPTIEGVRFLMVHRFEDIGIMPKGTDVVIYGHTHVPNYQKIGNITYVNPGSPTRPRADSLPGVGRLVVDDGKILSCERIEWGEAR